MFDGAPASRMRVSSAQYALACNVAGDHGPTAHSVGWNAPLSGMNRHSSAMGSRMPHSPSKSRTEGLYVVDAP
jgi:hypothetical protein